MLTVLANNLLREIILKRKEYNPSTILNMLDQELSSTFNHEENSQQTLDGLDTVLIRLDKDSDKVKYAGALRPLMVIRDGEAIEMKGDRYPIGLLEGVIKDFKTYEFELKDKDALYLYSDGYADQFGGPKQDKGGKKFSKKKMRELLLSIQDLSFEELAHFLEYAFNNWKQEIPQTDDIVLIGLQYQPEQLRFK